jgi:hypothetical protein
VTPTIPLPDPIPQPAPAWLLWALLQLTFLLHLVAMNLVLGGSVLALHWRASRRPADAEHRHTLLRAFTKALPVAVAAAVTLGIAPLLFVQVLYGRLFLTSSILMGWLWLAVIPLVVLAYYGAYVLAFGAESPGLRSSWLAAGVTLLFALVAFLYVTNVTRSLRPDTFLDVYRASGRGLALNLADPSFWPRYMHFLLGAVAVAAMAVALVGLLRRSSQPDFAAWAIRRGTTLFAAATAGNVFMGMVLLVAQPKPVLIRLLGGDTRAMVVLATGIFLAMALAGLGVLALGARDLVRITWALAGLLSVTLVVMVLLRDQVRQIALRNAGFSTPSWVVAQWGPFAVFVFFLLLAAVTIGWMGRALARERTTP